MDFDLDLFDRKGHRSSRRRDRDAPDRSHRRDGRDRGHRGRRAHPHVFAWMLVAGGGVAIVLLLIGLAAALGIWGHVADAYFAAARAILPASWHDEWMALPGFAHVALVLAALFVAFGLAGELLD